jgi:16S rRNA pseudouridine516 synthase
MAVMLHKPLGVTCSHKEAGPLVYDLLPARWRRRDPALSTVGRLDKDTSGLLLLTDDGALLHKIISPKSHLAKRYRATLARPLTGDEGAVFAAGTLMLEGEDKPLLPAALEPLSPTEAALTITEGRYHQVRRMFAAVGNHVQSLHRERVGGLALPADLEPGGYRLMTAGDLQALFGPT